MKSREQEIKEQARQTVKDQKQDFNKWLRAIARQRNLTIIETERYVNFMVKRFSPQTSWDYLDEWAQRFLTEHPENYMDGKSKKIYETVSPRIKVV